MFGLIGNVTCYLRKTNNTRIGMHYDGKQILLFVFGNTKGPISVEFFKVSKLHTKIDSSTLEAE